ncbi:hypothetical protein D6D12_09065 [Aureobasidium pullulans]|uniref:C2H2-type domain-containing protein n=1 Tax=Aureobasidium pullulans TaxID=5580 RepID=A0AB74JHD8_AURPU|nr:hypothetical protein D6D12_09065 [Aureobasidium pullulans]
MFKCNVCHKSYATQSSLTRHAHNHESGGRHTCAVSMKLGEARLKSNGSGVILLAKLVERTASSVMGNSHAALVRRPVQDVLTPGKRDVDTSGNVLGESDERGILMDDHDDDESNNDDEGSRHTDDQAPGLSPSTMLHETDTFSADQFPMTPGSLEIDAIRQLPPSSEEQEFANILASMHTAPHESFGLVPELWPTAINWPWAHEDLYLRNGPDYGPYDTSDLQQFPLATESLELGVNGGICAEQPINQAILGTNQLPDLDLPLTPTQTIDSIIKQALEVAKDNTRWTEFWCSSSRLVNIAFNVSTALSLPADVNVLNHFATIYLEQFQPLWPLLWQPGLQLDKLHPLLVLTMTSIGALYSGTATANYGSLLHEKMREVLLVSPSRTDHTDQENLDLGRAMLLTQVAAIYFEQQHAFSAAQRLGALLNAHAQKMQLFTFRTHRNIPTALDLTQANNVSAIQWHKQWVFAEGCKRLAYGIVRGEVFMSVLLNSKPLASYEEVDLELPYSDILWTTERQFAREYITAVSRDHSYCRGMIFSDLVRIALDPNEVLPLLQPLEHELLLYGLQYSVWRFSHDPGMFKRLTGHDLRTETTVHNSDFTSSGRDLIDPAEQDHLDYSTRKMQNLLRERQNVICALRKWKDMVANSQMSSQYGHNRTTYLSGLMLFHLSFLRLHAPVGTIQQIVYHQGSRSDFVKISVQAIADWARTDDATVAIKHACSMWTLIEKETSREQSSQARYTILTVISVYQAATVIWAVAGARETSRQFLSMMGASKAVDRDRSELSKANTCNLMKSFADLFPKMTSTWGAQSSFSKMVLGLAARTLD